MDTQPQRHEAEIATVIGWHPPGWRRKHLLTS
jgi:hypothetical protein